MTNRTNEKIAERLADSISQFWRERGYDVDATAVRVKAKSGCGSPLVVYEVVSDLVNGLPLGYRGPLHDLAIVGTPPNPPDTSAMRDCMCCTKPFESSGIGNRLCDYCLKQAGGTCRRERHKR